MIENMSHPFPLPPPAASDGERIPKVLIVEDHTDIRRLVALTLEFENYDIHEAANGMQGWQAAQEIKPDVALLDVMMPGNLDGFGLCRWIKAEPSLAHCKVIMLTAKSQASDIETGLAAGADAYLLKPFSPLNLIATIASVLNPPAALP